DMVAVQHRPPPCAEKPALDRFHMAERGGASDPVALSVVRDLDDMLLVAEYLRLAHHASQRVPLETDLAARPRRADQITQRIVAQCVARPARELDLYQLPGKIVRDIRL